MKQKTFRELVIAIERDLCGYYFRIYNLDVSRPDMRGDLLWAGVTTYNNERDAQMAGDLWARKYMVGNERA